MRTAIFIGLALALACDDAPKAEPSPSDAAPADAAPPTAKTADTADAVPPKLPATPQAEPGPLECDPWLAAGLLKTHCGVDLPFALEKNSTPTQITCSRAARAEDGGRISVTFEKLFGSKLGPAVRRRYPTPPELKQKHNEGRTVKGRAFPYLLTVDSRGKPMCSDEQLMALTGAILKALPAKPEPASTTNAACDALLTPADIESTCNKPGKVNASMMEDGKSLYCNRSGSGLVFIVSKHANDDLAKRGAEVAREDTAAGVAHKGPFSIELKSSMGANTCDKAGLDALAQLVAGRL